jgi:uncharacterized membrane protein YkoI
VKNGKQIAVSQLPPAVVKTLKDRWPRAQIKKAQEIIKGGAVSYELEMTISRQGKPMTIEVTLDSTGKVTNWENPETRLALSELPAKVLAAAKERFPGAELLKAEKETEEGKLIYEITLKHEGQRLEAEFDPEGNYLEMEVSVEVRDLPAPGPASAARQVSQCQLPARRQGHQER